MVALPVFAAVLYGGVIPREPLVRRVSPQSIQVGAFYNGTNVAVEGSVEAGSGVIVTVTGSENEAVFNKKVRFGPIWINSGKVRISSTPSVFLRFSSTPIACLLPPGMIAKYRLDEASLIWDMRIAPRSHDGRAEAAWCRSYLSMKKGDGSYAFASAGVRLADTSGGASFVLRFPWPKQAAPGAYTIHVYEIKDAAVIRQAEVLMPVVRTGFPAWLASLAGDHASLYGTSAVVIGALAGFGIDFLATLLFGKKRSVSH